MLSLLLLNCSSGNFTVAEGKAVVIVYKGEKGKK
jgi:hypothetical protein